MSISWELVQGGSLAQQSSLQLGMTHSQCAGENVEHLELSAPAGGTVNPHTHFKDCLAESTKAERTDSLRPRNSTPESIPNRNNFICFPKRYVQESPKQHYPYSQNRK